MRTFLFNAMTAMGRRGRLRFLPDAPYLRLQYFLKLGRILHIKRPKLYNEKLQWIKLHDRRPEYTQYADKLAVRNHVAKSVGEDYLIPLIAQYGSIAQIDWDALPDRFVLKCTHGSGSNIICADKSALNVDEAKGKLRGWMKRNWFWLSREWPYLDIKPRIIAEQFLGDDQGNVPFDYKIMCFEGEPTYIVVDADRYTAHTRNYYDVNWVKQPMENRHKNIPYDIPRPAHLAEMLSIARRLSAGIHHVRVDLYLVGTRIYFGEMTFFHGYGMEVFSPKEFELGMGARIKLPTDGGNQ